MVHELTGEQILDQLLNDCLQIFHMVDDPKQNFVEVEREVRFELFVS